MDTDAARIKELAQLIEAQQMRLSVISLALQTLLRTVDDQVGAWFSGQLTERTARLMQDHAHFVAPGADSAMTAELNALLAAASRPESA